ncbi:Trafficking kinesin-binding protein 2 [Oryzias melastigma]|uniref:Trafficking kinesin-binding protein 2 n=1 Tax=Oryzias melastigma TaxID=30732 RepID=A0A834BL31_ORYME|nr:Trafficking kinesin-binding protein 2 [Oryzias melastigma]
MRKKKAGSPLGFDVRRRRKRRNRKFSGAPLLSPPVTPTLPGSSSIRSDIGTTARHVTEPNFLAQPTSIASTPTQNLVPASTSSSCGSVSSPKTNDSFWLNLNFLPNFVSSVQNPGKCQSSTFSTYTFTTCRILHPSDVTQVTPSSQSSILANTPSSMRTGPSTPVTPCRLSLGDSFPPDRLLFPQGVWPSSSWRGASLHKSLLTHRL